MDHTQPPRRPQPQPSYGPPTNGHRVPPPQAHTHYGAPQGYVDRSPDPYRNGGYEQPYDPPRYAPPPRYPDQFGHRDTYATAFPDPYASAYSDPYSDPYPGDYDDGPEYGTDYGTDYGAHYGTDSRVPQDRIPAQRRAHQVGAPPRRRPEPRRRSKWPIVVVCVLLVPLLGLGACVALIGTGVQAVDNARQGGTVALGQSFRYASGVELAVTEPSSYTAPNEFAVQRGNVAYEATVTITNGTSRAMSAALVSMNATVAGAPAARVLDGAILPTQDIAPGQQLKVPFRFQVPKGTTGSLQIAVQDTFDEPVFFTGNL